MTKVFLYLANRSIRVGFLILAVIGLRFLFRKLPKGPQLLLWAVVALRLAVPFSPESPWSLLPSAEPLSSQATINTPLQRDPSILQAENEISVPAATEAPHVVTGAAPTTATDGQFRFPRCFGNARSLRPRRSGCLFPYLHRCLASGHGGYDFLWSDQLFASAEKALRQPAAGWVHIHLR